MGQNAKSAVVSGGHRRISVSNWKPLNKGSLRGFLTLSLPNGLIIHNCRFLEVGERSWVGLPALCFQAADGSINYRPVLDYKTKSARRNFEQAALHAVERFLMLRGEL